MIKPYHLFFLLLAMISCEKKVSKKEKGNDNVVRSYTKDGKLKTEIALKGGLKDGLCKNYYSNGKVSLEMVYKEGKRDGVAKQYYEDGTLYQMSEYKDDKLEGVRKKFQKDGRLMSELRFENNLACRFLKEYLEDGTVKTGYPTIVITPVDRIKQEGNYFLNITLSNDSKRVKYYKGKLSPSGCLSVDAQPLSTDTKKGMGQLKYYLSPGAFQMEEVNIIAEVNTSMGNTLILQRSFNVSIEN